MAEKRAGERHYERTPEMPSRRLRGPPPERSQHRESDHNKHNDDGQRGHDPQTHTPAEEKR